MNDPTGAAGLLLKLFGLRTEAALRQPRAWFAFEFHPKRKLAAEGKQRSYPVEQGPTSSDSRTTQRL